jgi:hypothetical protein
LTDEEIAPLEHLARAIPGQTPNSVARYIIAEALPGLQAILEATSSLESATAIGPVTSREIVRALAAVYLQRARSLQEMARSLEESSKDSA